MTSAGSLIFDRLFHALIQWSVCRTLENGGRSLSDFDVSSLDFPDEVFVVVAQILARARQCATLTDESLLSGAERADVGRPRPHIGSVLRGGRLVLAGPWHVVPRKQAVLPLRHKGSRRQLARPCHVHLLPVRRWTHLHTLLLLKTLLCRPKKLQILWLQLTSELTLCLRVVIHYWTHLTPFLLLIFYVFIEFVIVSFEIDFILQ